MGLFVHIEAYATNRTFRYCQAVWIAVIFPRADGAVAFPHAQGTRLAGRPGVAKFGAFGSALETDPKTGETGTQVYRIEAGKRAETRLMSQQPGSSWPMPLCRSSGRAYRQFKLGNMDWVGLVWIETDPLPTLPATACRRP